MGVGLQVFNDWGTVQIDQDYVSFAMSAKGTCSMTVDPAPHPQTMCIGQVTVTGQNPIISFLPPSGLRPVHLAGRRQVGNQFTFYFTAKSNGPFSLSYWIFDSAALGEGTGSNHGLQIFRADGSLAFDSGTKPLRIVGVVDLDPAAEENAGTITPPAGRTYAAVQGSMCVAFSHEFHSYQTGSSGEPGEEEAPDGGGGGSSPGGDVTGQWMTDRSFHSTVTKDLDGTLNMGISEFEQFIGLHGVGEPDSSIVHGDLMFWAVDVTNY